jgi:drug/metabolite transporter (DMT)-like permease
MRRPGPYLLLSIIILLWGVNYVVARVLSGFDPIRVSGILYALFRYLLAAITMVVVLGYQRKGPRTIRDEIRPYKKMLLLSAFLSAIFVMAVHMSAEFITSGATSIIVNLSPIVVLVFGVAFLREPLSKQKALGFLLGLAGGIVFLLTTLAATPSLAYGLFLALVGMVAWAAYTVTLHYLEGADRYIVMTVKHITSTIIIVPFVFLVMFEGTGLIFVLDYLTVLGLVFAGVLASGLAYVLYFTAIELLGAPRASSFLFLVPFVSVAGDIVLGEPPEVIAVLAGAIALLGVALVKLSDHGSPEEAADGAPVLA